MHRVFVKLVKHFNPDFLFFCNVETTSLTIVKLFQEKKIVTMNISSATEQEFEDVYLDITKIEKRFVQVLGKNYDGTGSYSTIKLLKISTANKERTKLKRTWRPRKKTHCDDSAVEKEN